MKVFFPFLAAGLLVAKAVAGEAGELTDAEKQGRALVATLMAENSTETYSRTGVMKVRDRERRWTEIPFRLQIVVTPTNRAAAFEITDPVTANSLTNAFKDAQMATPIAGSDFWVGDLAMEFLGWPGQRVLKSEMRRGRSCKVLESVNPEPGRGRYRRVVTWIDNDTGGIVQAEAYDEANKLLKKFEPKDVKKVRGRWEVKEMRLRNVQTGTQTVMEFDLPGE